MKKAVVLYSGGLKVTTTLDYAKQTLAEQAVARGIAELAVRMEKKKIQILSARPL